MRMVEITADEFFSLGKKVRVVVSYNNDLYIADPYWNELRVIDSETIGYELRRKAPFMIETKLPVKECRFYVPAGRTAAWGAAEPLWKKCLNKITQNVL